MSSYASTRDALVSIAKRIGIAFPLSLLADFEQNPVTALCAMVGILDESQLFPAGLNIDPKLKLAMVLVSSSSFLSVLGSDAKKALLLETSQQSSVANNLRTILASQHAFSKYIGMAVSMFVDVHDVHLMKVVLALEPLLERTEMLLSLGGDDRLTIDFNGMTKINKYFSSTLPRAEMIRRGSCTCSTITWNDYHVAEEIRYRLIQTVLTQTTEQLLSLQSNSLEAVKNAIAQVIHATNDDIRVRLTQVLGLKPSTAEIVLFPSGSDAELLPLIIALIRTKQSNVKLHNADSLQSGQSVSNGCVYNYVTAAGEVGSGTPNAAGGRHFSPMSPKSSHPYPILHSVVENNDDTTDDDKIGSVVSSQPQVNNGLLRGWECMVSESSNTTNKVGHSDPPIVVVQYKPRTSAGDVDFQEQQLIADIRTKLGPRPGSSVIASELDNRVIDADTTNNSNGNNVCVLHVVCGSKTGLVCPSQVSTLLCMHPSSYPLLSHPSTPFSHSSPLLNIYSHIFSLFIPLPLPLSLSILFQATIDMLQAEWKDRLIVVIDACQLRCHPHAIARYVGKGYLALVTGSKFFTGPPFSGAVVMPSLMARELEMYLAATITTHGDDVLNKSSLSPSSSSSTCVAVPRGLSDYLTPHEVPATMPHLQV